MYIESNELIRKAVIYKKVRNDYCGMIEYPTDLEEHHENA